MSAISFYESNGFISATLQGDEAVIALNKELDESPYVDGLWDGATHYVLDGEVLDRPVCPAVLTGLVLTDLPTPCVIDINGTKYDSDDATVELDLGASSHKITVIAFPYLDGVFNVEN